MVLGLGSRSRKDRASAITQLVELDLHLHEIRPWQGLARPSKALLSVLLRWSRGERLIGNSRNVNPTAASASEAGKILLGESLRIAVAPNREVLKRAKKLYPDLDYPLLFTLLDVNDPKGKPLAQGALDLSSLVAITEAKLVAVPFTVSKKVAKGPVSYLHLTVKRHEDDQAPAHNVSASRDTSARTSDASSVPPLDEDTQQRLVAALLSDDEDEGNNRDEEIDSFTDDDDDVEDEKEIHTPKVAHGLSPSQKNTGSSLPQANASVKPAGLPSGNADQRATVSSVSERQPERAEERPSRNAVAAPQAVLPLNVKADVAYPQPSPVKAAAIAAAAAYTKKHSFLPRRTNTYANDSDDSLSDLENVGDDGFSSRFSKIQSSPSLLPKGSQKAVAHSISQVNSFSARGLEDASDCPEDKSAKKAVKEHIGKGVDTNVSREESMVGDLHSKLTSSNSIVRTVHEAKVMVEGSMATVGTAESKGSAHGTTTQNILLSSMKGGGNDSRSRSVSETFLNLETSVQKISNNENSSSQRVEMAHTKSLVDLERGAVVRHPAKTSPEAKTKSSVKSPLRDKGPQKITISKSPEHLMGPQKISKSPDPMKGRPNQSPPVQDSKTSKIAVQEAKTKAFRSPDQEIEKVNKKVNDENRQKSSFAEGKGANAQSRIQQLEAEVENLKGELRDTAAVEAALYSTTAEHGGSSMKLHAPARRLARVYLYASKHWTQERRATCARNTMSGLVIVARACGNDVPRLTFWWSNTIVLREIISSSFNLLPASPKVGTSAHPSSPSERKISASSPNSTKQYQKQKTGSPSHGWGDWREPSTFTFALERLESWIYTKVVESIWWQVLTPQMQQPINQDSSETDDNDIDMRLDDRKYVKRVVTPGLEDARQGNFSVVIWRKAFCDAHERLCPVRSLRVECGCLPMLNRLVLEACVLRLDVAMFNAILRDDEAPTDPVSDPISNLQVLPIPNSSLSFGLGAQLKNAVATLSSFISNLSSKDGDYVITDGNLEDEEKNSITFPLLKAMGGLLMLPKDMLIDKSMRKEVCPTLRLPFIGKILSKFQPDEFSPEPITPELLDTINAEMAAECDMQEDTDDRVAALRMAFSPPVIYTPPPSSVVRQWIGETVSTPKHFGRNNSSILRKGHTSDDEIDELESPISWLFDNTMGASGYNHIINMEKGAANSPKNGSGNCRFMLLREVWSNS